MNSYSTLRIDSRSDLGVNQTLISFEQYCIPEIRNKIDSFREAIGKTILDAKNKRLLLPADATIDLEIVSNSLNDVEKNFDLQVTRFDKEIAQLRETVTKYWASSYNASERSSIERWDMANIGFSAVNALIMTLHASIHEKMSKFVNEANAISQDIDKRLAKFQITSVLNDAKGHPPEISSTMKASFEAIAEKYFAKMKDELNREWDAKLEKANTVISEMKKSMDKDKVSMVASAAGDRNGPAPMSLFKKIG